MNFPRNSSPGVTNRKPNHPYAPLPGPSSSSSYPNGVGGGAAGAAYTLERQNDQHVDRLHEKAAMLKHLTLNLGVEIDESNKFLDTMNTSFVQTEGLLGSASRKLKDLSRSGGANLWCYMTLFIFCVFLFVYFALGRK